MYMLDIGQPSVLESLHHIIQYKKSAWRKSRIVWCGFLFDI